MVKCRYNCTILDLAKREAVATVNSKWINTDLAIKALSKAIEREKPEKGLFLHSDQGMEFTSWHLQNTVNSKELFKV